MESCPEVRKITVHVISDSLGDTACEVVLAAAGQFSRDSVHISRLPHVNDVSQVQRYLEPYIDRERRLAVFHTIVDPRLRSQVLDYLSSLHVRSVDLIGPSIAVLSSLTGEQPRGVAGTIHATDERYFRRIEAMEFFIEHDDGRRAEEVDRADIVILGVSRTSKTPLSMYLAAHGYKVANIPLASGIEPPVALFDIDPMKIFGLLSSVEVVSGIRDTRLGSDDARAVAGSYADERSVQNEMDEARALYRRLGCFTVRTDHKSIEESASEIISRIESVERARLLRNSNR